MLAGQFFQEPLLGSLITCRLVRDHPRWSHSVVCWLAGQGTSILFRVVPPAEKPWFLMSWWQHSKHCAPMHKHLPQTLSALPVSSDKAGHVTTSSISAAENGHLSHSTNLIEQNLLKRLFIEAWAGLITSNSKSLVD